MTQRNNHYEAAFEEFLRQSKTAYVAVDEQRRAQLEQESLKSMDFIVYSRSNSNLLVDVKGRRFPTLGEAGGSRWENWATAEDIESLLQWEEVFGSDFRALLVFAYHVFNREDLKRFETSFCYRERVYAFYGVWVADFQAAMTTRSNSWDTVSLPNRRYRDLREPISQFL